METPFVAQAGGNLMIQGDHGIEILELLHPQSQIRSRGNLCLVGDGMISADARFDSGGNFQAGSLSGQLVQFHSLYDPVISAVGNMDITGGYSGPSLLIESQRNVRIGGDVNITAPDTVPGLTEDDAVFGTQARLIVRSGQTQLVYGRTNQNNHPSLTTGVISDETTLAGQITTPGCPVRLDAGMGNVKTAGMTTNGSSIAITSTRGDITTSGVLDSSSSSNYSNAGNGSAITVFASKTQ